MFNSIKWVSSLIIKRLFESRRWKCKSSFTHK